MIESKITRLIKQSIPLFIAILSFSILLTGSFIFSNYRKSNLGKKMQKTRLYEILIDKKKEISNIRKIETTTPQTAATRQNSTRRQLVPTGF